MPFSFFLGEGKKCDKVVGDETGSCSMKSARVNTQQDKKKIRWQFVPTKWVGKRRFPLKKAGQHLFKAEDTT